jgi:hypothetical protein
MENFVKDTIFPEVLEENKGQKRITGKKKKKTKDDRRL